MQDKIADPAMPNGLRVAVAGRDTLGESPLWDWRTNRLVWVDIKRYRIQWLDPKTGNTTWIETPDQVGAIGLRRGGGLIVALRHALAHWDENTGFTQLVEIEPDMPGNRTNDGRVDRQGRFWIGTMSNDTRDPTGALYLWNGATLAKKRDAIIVPNALAWSPMADQMYFADTWNGDVEISGFDPATGTMSNTRAFVTPGTLAGVADGGIIDKNGAMWNARYGGGQVARILPDGTISDIIALPTTQVTSCALGDADMRTLYITSATQRMTDADLAKEPQAGSVFAIRVGVPGLPEPEFVP